MLVGRRIWIIREPANGMAGYIEGGDKGIVVTEFLRFLPKESYQHPTTGHLVDRKVPLIQLKTNPPGIRTLTVGSIRTRRPY